MIDTGRLIILQELAKQTSARSNDQLMERTLDACGISRSRAWVRTQLRALEEIGAVQLDEAGGLLIVTLRAAGRDHVERRGRLEGVARPSDVA